MVGMMIFWMSIPAGDAGLATNEWSRQTQIQVLFDFTEMKGERTLAVEGWYYPSTSITLMFRDTDMKIDWINSRTISIMRGPVPTCKPWLGADAPLPPCKQRKTTKL